MRWSTIAAVYDTNVLRGEGMNSLAPPLTIFRYRKPHPRDVTSFTFFARHRHQGWLNIGVIIKLTQTTICVMKPVPMVLRMVYRYADVLAGSAINPALFRRRSTTEGQVVADNVVIPSRGIDITGSWAAWVGHRDLTFLWPLHDHQHVKPSCTISDQIVHIRIATPLLASPRLSSPLLASHLYHETSAQRDVGQ